jgi:glycosyltransferase XagB
VLSLVVGNFFFYYVNFMAVLHRERWHLVHAVILMPLYWLLMSVAAWRAVGQLVTSLHMWEKTPHGLSGQETDPAIATLAPGAATPEPALLEPKSAVP